MLLGIAIIIANVIVIVTFFRFRKKILRRKNNRILLSLAFADTFVGVFCITFAASMLAEQETVVYKSLGNIPLFGSMFISIFSLILLTFDRLFAITKPLQYPSIVTGKRLNISLISSWLLTLVLLVQQYILYFCYSSNLELKVRGIFLVVCFFLGATVLGITNYCLFTAIRKHTSKLNSTNSAMETPGKSIEMPERKKSMSLFRKNRGRVKKSELTASKECFYIVMIFICSLLPLSVYRLLYTSGIKLNLQHPRRVFLILALASSFINPWIYFFKKQQFRKYMVIKVKNDGCSEESSLVI